MAGTDGGSGAAVLRAAASAAARTPAAPVPVVHHPQRNVLRRSVLVAGAAVARGVVLATLTGVSLALIGINVTERRAQAKDEG